MKKPYEEPVLEITMFSANMGMYPSSDGVDDDGLVDLGGEKDKPGFDWFD